MKDEARSILRMIARAVPRAVITAALLGVVALARPEVVAMPDACAETEQGTPDATALRHLEREHSLSWSESRSVLYRAATTDVCQHLPR